MYWYIQSIIEHVVNGSDDHLRALTRDYWYRRVEHTRIVMHVLPEYECNRRRVEGFAMDALPVATERHTSCTRSWYYQKHNNEAALTKLSYRLMRMFGAAAKELEVSSSLPSGTCWNLHAVNAQLWLWGEDVGDEVSLSGYSINLLQLYNSYVFWSSDK